MSNRAPLPADPDLRAIAQVLEQANIQAELMDGDWRVVYVTSEYLRSTGLDPGVDIGIVGLEFFDAACMRLREAWPWPAASPDQLVDWFAAHGGAIAADVGLDRIRAVALPEIIAAVEAADPGLDWLISGVTVTQLILGNELRFHVDILRLRGADGRLRAVVSLIRPDLPGFVLSMLALGDPTNFERLSRLLEPAQRPGAVLFADLQSSTRLSRELSSRAYFDLVRSFAVEVDEIVIRHAGVVGKHAGDGASAFFLVQECGSPSGAARAGIEAARAVVARLDAVGEAAGLPAGKLKLSAGVHWGEHIYVGDLITSGRLEATAFGEEVNEAARIEQTAEGGQILATKTLLELLDPLDAQALDLDPHHGAYIQLGDLPGAGEKARRDAGTIPVREV